MRKTASSRPLLIYVYGLVTSQRSYQQFYIIANFNSVYFFESVYAIGDVSDLFD